MSTDLVGKENLPNVYIKEIAIENVGKRVKISPTVQLYDRNDTWYSDERIRSNLKVMVVCSHSSAFNRNVTRGKATLTPKHISKTRGYDPKEVVYKVFSLNGVSRQAFENEVDRGTYVFPYRCSFRRPKKPDVSVFAVAYFDTVQFGNQNALELSDNSINAYHGAIVGEKVFESGAIPTETSFFKAGSSLYTGPVYRVGRTVKEGSRRSSTPHRTLTLVKVKNTKIKDYRISFIAKRRNRRRARPFIGELYTSVGDDNKTKNVFPIDIQEMFLRTSRHAYLLHSMAPSLFVQVLSQLKLTDVAIYKQHTIQRTRTSRSGTKRIVNVPIGGKKFLIESMDSRGGILKPIGRYQEKTKNRVRTVEKRLTTAHTEEYPLQSAIRELYKDRGDTHRQIFFQDNSNGSRASSMVSYSVDFAYKDPSIDFLKSLTAQHKRGLNMLRNYKAKLERRTNYNYYANQTKENLYSDAGDEAWAAILSSFLNLYTLMFKSDGETMDQLYDKLAVLIHPKTATVSSLGWFYSKYLYMFSRYSKYFDTDNSVFNTPLKLGYVKGDPNKGKVKFSHRFRNIVDFGKYKKTISFIPNDVAEVFGPDGSFPTVTYAEYRAMAKNERNKYFKEKPSFNSTSVPFLSPELISGLNNISYGSYTHFSPAQISSGYTRDIDLSKVESIDLFDFNRIFNQRAKTRRSIAYRPDSDRQNQIKNKEISSFYIKNRERQKEDLNENFEVDKDLGMESNFNKSKKEELKLRHSRVNRDILNRFSSFDSMREDDLNPSMKDFTLTNEKNVLADIYLKQIPMSRKRKIIRDLPLQIKALLGSKYGFTRNNMFYANRDLLRDSMVSDLIKTLFMTVTKVQYMTNRRVGGNISQTQWRDMTEYTFNNLIVRNRAIVLCRLVPYQNDMLKVNAEITEAMGLESKYFYLARTKEAPESVRRFDGRRGRNSLAVTFGTYEDNKIAFQETLKNFSNNTSFIACRTHVIKQPDSKNGPLGSVDYGIANDLVETPTPPLKKRRRRAAKRTRGGSY